jgi:hypothetical protein
VNGSNNFVASASGNAVALTVAQTINNIPGQTINPVQLNINNTGATGQISFVCNVQLAGSPIPPLQKNFPICTLDLSQAPAKVTVSITTAPPTTSMANPGFPGSAPRVAGIYALSTPLAGILGLLVMGSSRRKKYWSRRKLASLLGMMIVLALLMLAVGCGGGFNNSGNVVPTGSNGTQPGQYVVSVIGTDANGKTVAVAAIPVNVQI